MFPLLKIKIHGHKKNKPKLNVAFTSGPDSFAYAILSLVLNEP